VQPGNGYPKLRLRVHVERPIRIRFFATAREAAGRSVSEIDVPRKGLSVSQVLGLLTTRYPRLGPVLRTCRFVRNGEYLTGLTGRVFPGDEFAIHPPYTGG
jgi:molybdopterin converting factor small subunit